MSSLEQGRDACWGALVSAALKKGRLLVKCGADTHRCIQLGAKIIGLISNQLEYT